MRHFLEIDDLTPSELREVMELAKADPASHDNPYDRNGVACLFEKPSARTRNSTEMAVVQLGGHPIYIQGAEVGIDTRESAEDIARTLACYHEVICARVMKHPTLVRMAATNSAPVVNLLCDEAHPCQALADALTIEAEFGSLEGRVVTFIGDANNVARSLALVVTALGGEFRIASPEGYEFSDRDLAHLEGTRFTAASHLDDVIDGSDVIYADTWTSMGHEEERNRRLADFAGFQVDDSVMARVPDAIFMHCLPAHRGEEVTDSVLDGPQSRIWPQAANRTGSVRGVLAWLAQVRA